MKRIPGTTKGPIDSLLPCPFCTADLEPFGPKRSNHPRNGCLLSSVKIDAKEYPQWNLRAVVVKEKAVSFGKDVKSSEKLTGSTLQRDDELQITELLEKLLRRLADPPRPVPLPIDAWDAECIARYMKRSAYTVRREIVVQPTFPRPMRIPGAGRAQALYKAREVVAWLESQQEKLPAPRRARAAL